ncbi:magnesium transporter NIPA-domain-containing protein [Chlamydoabsidia padenii]|nr:magnesium transporter NIPA-domain-containing protein [Chlamydoabsidia padenii]
MSDTGLASETMETHGALYKSIGVTLAVASGVFIGSSFVFKKKGLLDSNARSGCAAGEGYGYLKSAMWWTGMILMVVGEACNFVAYAFAPAILVTPLGALSVVLSAVLSSIFLKEGLTFQGVIGCIQCVLGAIIIVLHAPEEGAADNTIATFRALMLSTGFMTYSVFAVGVSLFLVFYCGPRWGNQNMLVYITVCSLIGSLSVVFTQGIGGTIVHSLAVENQFDDWFVYLVLALTLVTLMVEIIYLNKALNIFNTALVTPTYYVIFTTLTIVSATVFYRGFEASGTDVTTCVFGFLIICSGVALLHHSRSQPQRGRTQDGDDERNIGEQQQRRNSILHLFDKDDDDDDDDDEKYMDNDPLDDDDDDDEHTRMLPGAPQDKRTIRNSDRIGGRYVSSSRKSLAKSSRRSRHSSMDNDHQNGIELVTTSHHAINKPSTQDVAPHTLVKMDDEHHLKDPAQQQNGTRLTPITNGSPSQNDNSTTLSDNSNDLMDGWDHYD